jgi:hypothetical protein
VKTKIIEATNGDRNWGKFCVMGPDVEWLRRSTVSESQTSLLRQIGWGPEHIWVLDLQTGEGAYLQKHRIWVCPLFEPFLGWLYQQDTSDLEALPDSVDLPDAPFQLVGYRRQGPPERVA